MQDNRGPEIAVATGIEYTLSPAQLGPLFISMSNGIVDLEWSGPGTLQCSASPVTGTWTNLTDAASPYSVSSGEGQQFFRLAE